VLQQIGGCVSAIFLISVIGALLVLIFFVAKVWRCKGLFRLPGAVAISVISFALIKIEIDIKANPTTHNLLPFEIIIWSILSLIIYWIVEGGVVWIANRNNKKPRTD
jgi:hypothetical protein